MDRNEQYKLLHITLKYVIYNICNCHGCIYPAAYDPIFRTKAAFTCR